MTPNGKLDRRALPEPEYEAYASRGYENPRERSRRYWQESGQNCSEWSESAGGMTSSPWEAIIIGSESDVTYPPGSDGGSVNHRLFSHSVLKDFGQIIERSSRLELPPIKVIDCRDRVELSLAQRRIWFLSQMTGVSQAYHVSGGLRLRGDLDYRRCDRHWIRSSGVTKRCVQPSHQAMEVQSK